ncbi:SAM-dependent methyltransferase [Gloeocapsopsis crepidinum LEGE 06123]|uniref:SAM-dependent methyltransferase n=1 Tax=Gloeocapsopsis crepidinum LEGE 06123 TaxID=588587 RepID=A0ABR9UWF0_9CHRO|nr:SAM-dependent methyltransferase [Gloeocapsopsis crepidinum]MBE9192614.1 SAM-dependent methyltransferase [Gloeocapsopsis crepidinum LEGE 06123]
MSFQLENVVPWGRSLPDYIKMFGLTLDDFKLRILDCAGGPASFNAEITKRGYKVVSCDPIYQFTHAEIAQRIQETYPVILKGVQETRDHLVWQDIESPEQLGKIRMAAMRQFLDDFPTGVAAGRYITAELPNLPFDSGEFDLALCAHLLFTYSEQFSLEFHLQSVLELCRVAKEVRIFPLLVNFSNDISPWLEPVITHLQNQGYTTEIKQVAYEFQKGGNQLLRVYK